MTAGFLIRPRSRLRRWIAGRARRKKEQERGEKRKLKKKEEFWRPAGGPWEATHVLTSFNVSALELWGIQQKFNKSLNRYSEKS